MALEFGEQSGICAVGVGETFGDVVREGYEIVLARVRSTGAGGPGTHMCKCIG